MYGTVAHMKLKAGKMDDLKKQMTDFDTNRHPKGYLGEIIYQMDSNQNEIMMAVFFDSKENYHANANDPEQDKEFRKMRDLLDADPEWHDGEVIHQFWMK
ncbi:MAG: hypothetical protein WBD55_06895 [Dehalococcoidia bacterium]